ncbi:MAG TPA: serine/threonine-protein kinase [Trebonia sp.]|jgi:serine/threonine protein kinase
MESEVPGRLIAGRYRLGTVVGRGGMGIVWQARDEVLGRDVAVKELAGLRHFSARERDVARRHAVREARATARLSHRNVVQVFDILEEDGCPWIVMELITPRSLRDLIHQEGPLSPGQAAQLGLEILAALRAAHRLGIVHRDVKPANILMAPDRAVLVDFGIAQAAESLADVTTASMLIGSPAYIAPERARGGTCGPPADLWGLGASLYAAVEGSGPFERGGGAMASLTAVVADEPEPAPHAGPLLWPVISGLLRKDPDERLDAAEAERMLRLAVAADSPASAAGSPVRTVTRRRRRSTATAAALVGSAALAVVAVSATAAVLDHSSQPRHQATAAAARSAAGRSTQPTSPPTSGTGSRHPAAGLAPGTHLTSRTQQGPTTGSANPEGEAQPDNAVPHGHIGKPAKPGKGKDKAGKPGKGNGKGG